MIRPGKRSRSLLSPRVAAFTSFARATGKAALCLFSVAVLLAGGTAAVRGQSALDGFDPNANGLIRVVVVQPDGKILIGGDFTTLSPNGGGPVTRNRIARLNPDGTLDTAFDPSADNNVWSIAVQADGKILAGGAFNGANSIGGQTRNRIARLDATTGLADSFDPNASNDVYSVAVGADGKILAGGDFTVVGGQVRNLFARLSNDTAALQNLTVTRTTIAWIRGGSSPQLARAIFEYSTDNVNYTALGDSIPQSGSSNWILTGLNLPTGQNFYIRARGYSNGSESITESVRNAFVSVLTPTSRCPECARNR